MLRACWRKAASMLLTAVQSGGAGRPNWWHWVGTDLQEQGGVSREGRDWGAAQRVRLRRRLASCSR